MVGVAMVGGDNGGGSCKRWVVSSIGNGRRWAGGDNRSDWIWWLVVITLGRGEWLVMEDGDWSSIRGGGR